MKQDPKLLEFARKLASDPGAEHSGLPVVLHTFAGSPKPPPPFQTENDSRMAALRGAAADGRRTIFLTGRDRTKIGALLAAAERFHLDGRQVVLIPPGEAPPRLRTDEPVLRAGAAFVCRGNACSAPITEPKFLVEYLGR
jgi:uncharacterized protein YyaL (SSP411 family)